MDSLVLVGRTGGMEWPDMDKTSVVATLHIYIKPVNDQIPHFINNTGLVIWAGATIPIQNSNLGIFSNFYKAPFNYYVIQFWLILEIPSQKIK